MGKGTFIPELQHPYESLVRTVCGSQWRGLSSPEIDAAWGVAIVRSILDGVRPDPKSIAAHLGIEREMLINAFKNLNMNGIFRNDAIHKDRKALLAGDKLAWGYYGGYAAGMIGPWSP